MDLWVWQCHHTTSTALNIPNFGIPSYSDHGFGVLDEVECDMSAFIASRGCTYLVWVHSGCTTTTTWAFGYDSGTSPLQLPSIYQINAYQATATLAWG